jgi:hypothetical protein
MPDAATTEDDQRPSLLEDLFGVLPRFAERTAAQVGLVQTVLSMLPCTRGLFARQDEDAATTPQHEARQPTDVLTVLAEDEPGPGAAEAGDAAEGEQEQQEEQAEPPAPPVDELAIPDYDSLAASQVVPRLTTMSTEELEAIGAYESANRRRRTILNRVTQLLAD